MTGKKVFFIGCGALSLVAFVGVLCVVWFVIHVSKGVEGVVVTVNGPPDVVVGQTFDLEVVVKNERPSKALDLTDVDLAEAYLEGFTVASVKPTPKSNMHVPIDDSRSFTFNLPVAAHTTKSFIFTLRAEKAGMYRGDVDVCEGVQVITSMAQTVVKEKE